MPGEQTYGLNSPSNAPERAPEKMGERPVEFPSVWRLQELPLADPGDREGEHADLQSQLKLIDEVAAPRLQIRIAQPAEPRSPGCTWLYSSKKRNVTTNEKNGCEIELSPQSSSRGRQHRQPGVRGIAQAAELGPRIGEQEPAALLVVCENGRHAVRPATA
jgi:hypothetical protein